MNILKMLWPWRSARRESRIMVDSYFGVPRERSGQQILCEVDEAATDGKLYRTLTDAWGENRSGGYVPVGALMQKVKVVTDGVLARLEELSSDALLGVRSVRGFLALLALELDALPGAAGPGMEKLERYLGSALCGGGLLGQENDQGQAVPMMDPLGFYSWSEQLQEVFRRDRFLQQAELSEESARSIAGVLHRTPALRSAYELHLRRTQFICNALSGWNPDLRARLAALDQGRAFQRHHSPFSSGVEVLFPPACAPENQFRNAEDFLDSIERGAVSLAPDQDSGFYAYQLFALASLLLPETGSENAFRSVGPGYRAVLRKLVKGGWALSRETVVKHLALTPLVMAPPQELYPGLTVEPQPTYFERLANALHFLSGVLCAHWGPEVGRMLQMRSGSRPGRPIDDGLRDCEALCRAAAHVSRIELGDQELLPEGKGFLEECRQRLRTLAEDKDLEEDVRGMVPLSESSGGGERRALVTLGWKRCKLKIGFSSAPAAHAGYTLGDEYHVLLVPHTEEMLVRRLLNQEEFRSVCDREQEAQRILACLTGA